MEKKFDVPEENRQSVVLGNWEILYSTILSSDPTTRKPFLRPAPAPGASQKPSSGDISVTESGIIDPLVSK